MKRYKVTTEVSLIVEAEDEDDASLKVERELGFHLYAYDPDKVLSKYYEVEEVSD